VKWFTVARSARTLALYATMWAATAALMSLLPVAYGQQEVDPTWYDPWATPVKVVAQPSQPRTSNHKPKQKTVTAVSQRKQPKLRAKRSVGGGS